MTTKARFYTGLLILASSLLTTTLHAGQSGSSDVKAADGLYNVYEIAEWATPVVSFMAQKEASLRYMRAGPNQVLFWSKPLDHRNKILTPNNVSLYLSTQIETFDGPMVMEIPAPENGVNISGSFIDPFQLPLADVGGKVGIDKGKGGKVLITPPGYEGAIPEGYLHLPNEHYNTVAGWRFSPPSLSEEGLSKTVALIKKIRLYPLADPKRPTVFVDSADKPYDPRIPYDENYFRLINDYVQTEVHKDRDMPFIRSLEKLGIKKGVAYQSNPEHIKTLKDLKRDLVTKFVENKGMKFSPDSNWDIPLYPRGLATKFSYVDNDGYHWKERAELCYWAIWFPKHIGGNTFYLIDWRDSDGKPLKADGIYEITIPANVPAKVFWSLTAYNITTGGVFFDDVKKVAISSKDDLVFNADGSVTLTYGPELPAGRPASNHVPLNGKGYWFGEMRFYGPEKPLFDKSWQMKDFELINRSSSAAKRVYGQVLSQ